MFGSVINGRRGHGKIVMDAFGEHLTSEYTFPLLLNKVNMLLNFHLLAMNTQEVGTSPISYLRFIYSICNWYNAVFFIPQFPVPNVLLRYCTEKVKISTCCNVSTNKKTLVSRYCNFAVPISFYNRHSLKRSMLE
jgi:hypothetical protein